MNREWQKPGLEVLDVKMTMSSPDGSHGDGAWNDHLLNLSDDGDGDGESDAGVLS